MKVRSNMADRSLTQDELTIANELLTRIREDLAGLSGGDEGLLWVLRRKVYKELTYDERGKPIHRKRLKRRRESSRTVSAPSAKGHCPRNM